MSKIEVKDKKFYVLVGKEFSIYDDQKEAVADLKDELKDNENAIVAEITYEDSESGDKQGTFNVNPLSWKDIAMGWI